MGLGHLLAEFRKRLPIPPIGAKGLRPALLVLEITEVVLEELVYGLLLLPREIQLLLHGGLQLGELRDLTPNAYLGSRIHGGGPVPGPVLDVLLITACLSLHTSGIAALLIRFPIGCTLFLLSYDRSRDCKPKKQGHIQ